MTDLPSAKQRVLLGYSGQGMTVGLFITCINDVMFPQTGQAVVKILGSSSGCKGQVPQGADLLRADDHQHWVLRRVDPDRQNVIWAFYGYEYVVAPSRVLALLRSVISIRCWLAKAATRA